MLCGLHPREKVKIQLFFIGLPTFYKEQITYDESHTLKECIQKDKCMYEQGKSRHVLHKRWKSKLKVKKD